MIRKSLERSIRARDSRRLEQRGKRSGWNRTIPELSKQEYHANRAVIRESIRQLIDHDGEVNFSDAMHMASIYEASRGSWHAFSEYMKGFDRRDRWLRHLAPGEWAETVPAVSDAYRLLERTADRLLKEYGFVTPAFIAHEAHMPERLVRKLFPEYKTTRQLKHVPEMLQDERGKPYLARYYKRP